jgi:hypothetical protein
MEGLMVDSIQDYVKGKQLEGVLATGLMEQLSYLMSCREEIASNLVQVDEMIDGIVVEMRAAGIDIE